MPLARRLPKRGFNNIFAKRYTTVRLDRIAGRFQAGETVDLASLRERGVVRSVLRDGIKVLGNGEIGHALNFRVAGVTGSARTKIEAAGGTVEAPAPRSDYTEVRLNAVAKAFSAGDVVDAESLVARGVVSEVGASGVRLHGYGKLGYALTVRVAKLSRTAAAKIRAAGGRVEVI
jgi:ribosomal protein L15